MVRNRRDVWKYINYERLIIKQLKDEDFLQYRKSSMFIGFPNCTFKCEKECNIKCCQNSELANADAIEIDVDNIVNRYINNSITESIVFGGLDPFDSWNDVYILVRQFRLLTDDDIVIYTGYTEEEISDKIQLLSNYKNIIVKFGRFRPNCESHLDEVLGVSLASPNQYARKIS